MGFEYYQPVNVGQCTATPAAQDVAEETKPETKEPIAAEVAEPAKPTSLDNNQPETVNTPTEEKAAVQEPATSDNNQVSEQEFAETLKKTKEEMLDKLGIKDAPEEKQKQILETIDQRVAVAITKAVIENASPDLARDIEDSIDSGKDIEEVVATAVENDKALQSKIEEAVKKIWEKILSESDAVKAIG